MRRARIDVSQYMVKGGEVSVDVNGRTKLGAIPFNILQVLERDLHDLTEFAKRRGTCDIDSKCTGCTEAERKSNLAIRIGVIRTRKHDSIWKSTVDDACKSLGLKFIWGTRTSWLNYRGRAKGKTEVAKSATLITTTQQVVLDQVAAMKAEKVIPQMFHCRGNAQTGHKTVTYKDLASGKVHMSACKMWKYGKLGKAVENIHSSGMYVTEIFVVEMKKLKWTHLPTVAEARSKREKLAEALRLKRSGRGGSKRTVADDGDWDVSGDAKRRKPKGNKRAREEQAEEDEKMRERSRARRLPLSS